MCLPKKKDSKEWFSIWGYVVYLHIFFLMWWPGYNYNIKGIHFNCFWRVLKYCVSQIMVPASTFVIWWKGKLCVLVHLALSSCQMVFPVKVSLLKSKSLLLSSTYWRNFRHCQNGSIILLTRKDKYPYRAYILYL